MYVPSANVCMYICAPSQLLCLTLLAQPVGLSCMKMWMKQGRIIVAESVAPKCYTHCETGISLVSGKKHVMVQLSACSMQHAATTSCQTTESSIACIESEVNVLKHVLVKHVSPLFQGMKFMCESATVEYAYVRTYVVVAK